MDSYRTQQARAYLQEIRDLFIHVRALQADIEIQRGAAEGITGIDYTRLAARTAADADAIPRAVVDLLDLIGQACAELADCVERQDEARRCLESMGGVESDLLRLRYLLAMSWKQVAASVNYSESWAKHLEPDALFCFYDYMPAYRRDPKHPSL